MFVVGFTFNCKNSNCANPDRKVKTIKNWWTGVERPVNIVFYGVDAEVLQSMLDVKGIAVSAGSACSSLRERKSHVLEALGDKRALESSIRFSLSKFTTKKEIDVTIKVVSDLVEKLRSDRKH